MNNQDYHVRHGQTFLTLQESLLTNFQLIRKDIVDPPPIQGYPSSKPSVSGSYRKPTVIFWLDPPSPPLAYVICERSLREAVLEFRFRVRARLVWQENSFR